MAAVDQFPNHPPAANAGTTGFTRAPGIYDVSATSAVAVTPSDTVDLTYVSRAIFVGGAGNVAAIMADGSTATFTGVTAGTFLHIRASRIKATGTTATNMVALS